jgi:hypothetical protein
MTKKPQMITHNLSPTWWARTRLLESYSINSVTGDQYYCDAIGQQLLNLGIAYKSFIFGAQTRGKIFSQVKQLARPRKNPKSRMTSNYCGNSEICARKKLHEVRSMFGPLPGMTTQLQLWHWPLMRQLRKNHRYLLRRCP